MVTIRRSLKVYIKGVEELCRGQVLTCACCPTYAKGVLLIVPHGKMSGDFFVQFIHKYCNLVFGQAGQKTNGRRLFVMDNDPSQGVFEGPSRYRSKLLEIPACSPDVDCIPEMVSRERDSASKYNQRIVWRI